MYTVVSFENYLQLLINTVILILKYMYVYSRTISQLCFVKGFHGILKTIPDLASVFSKNQSCFMFQQAFGEICLLWLNIAGCVYTFYPINKAAAGLMLPYLGWVTLATALNYTIWQMNKPAIKED